MKIQTIKIDGKDELTLVWLHGWGQNGAAWREIVPMFRDYAHVIVDLPGFGESEAPSSVWGSDDYARAVLGRIGDAKATIVIGHSFGGKVALQMAHLDKRIKGVVLIGASGLPRTRSLFFKIRALTLKLMGKAARLWDGWFKTDHHVRFRNKFGSRDYKAAQGVMRDILVKNVNENLTELARQTDIPALIIYGAQDQETPPEIGRRYAGLLKNSRYHELPSYDHYTILSHGRHQIHTLISSFLGERIL